MSEAGTERTDARFEAGTGDHFEARIKSEGIRLGFDLVGICQLGPVESAGHFSDWLAHGFAGEMSYLGRRAEERQDSRRPVAGASSAIVVALNYGGTAKTGSVARYARGDDYHDVILKKLTALHKWIDLEVRRSVPGKGYVDTGPILERDLARRAGLGWFGKNTNLLNPALGSFFFLGALLIDLELAADAPFEADRCGSCTRCIDACPTGAILEPRVLDATQCISYLTIEQRGPIPLELRPAVGELVYGCDICQDVCPWNIRFSRDVREPELAPRPEVAEADARDFIALSEEDFRARFRRSPVTRAKRRGLARNAAVALGNRGDPDDVDVLAQALTTDAEPLVRGHAAWALGAIARRRAEVEGRIRGILVAAGEREEDATVRAELHEALGDRQKGATIDVR